MIMLPVLLLGFVITAGNCFSYPEVAAPQYSDPFPAFAKDIQIYMPEEWQPSDPLPPYVNEAEFIEDMVKVYLESLRRNGKICQDEEDRIWQKMHDCLEEVINEPELVERLKNWEVMTEFIELAVTSIRKYLFTATVPEDHPMAIFKRLTPVRFWRILQDVPFPVADGMHFRRQKRATVQILELVCEMELPDEITDQITMAEIRDVFLSIVIKSYLGDSITYDNEERLRSSTRARDLRCEWEEIAFNALHDGSLLKTTCIDPELKEHTERSCIQEIRTIAADLGVEGCEMKSIQPFETLLTSYSFAPVFEKEENKEAPEMQRTSSDGAPSGPQARSGGAPSATHF